MKSPRLPSLSVRASLLLAVLAAVLVPALLWLLASALPWSLPAPAAPWRAAVLLLVVVQGVAGALLVLGLLSRRLEEPLARLTEQALGLAGLRPVATLAPAELAPELAPLAQGMDEVRQRVGQLQGELQAGRARLRKAAMYDTLTGLPNRTLLQELFGHEAASARRQGRSLALLRIGLDRLAEVSDTLGHSVGEELLTGMAHRLDATLRDADFLCRGGDDDFLVLLAGPVGWDRVASAAERLLRCVEQPLQLPRSGQLLGASASIGIAMYPSDGADFESLARAASLALQRSRTLGRGLYSFYQPALDQALRERIDAERELALALERDEFTLVYQPMLDARSGRVVGCEALLRWQHPQRGLVPPGEFIPIAECTELIVQLDRWVLGEVVALLARSAGCRPAPTLSVNVSPRMFASPGFVDELRTLLAPHPDSARRLVIELTEGVLVHDPEVVAERMAALGALGVRFSIDDFGTGYSSLTYLKRLPLHELKIDRSFIHDLNSHQSGATIVAGIVSVAGHLRLEVVAEGVETAVHADWLTVCELHLGLARGVAEAIGGIEVTDLAPTDPSEPRCVLRCRLTEGQGTGPTM